MNNKPKILTVGTGAVGGYYSGRLSQAGASVSAVCRTDFDTVAKNGIQIKSIQGNFTFYPEHVVRTVSEYSSIPDYILVATKALPEIDIPSIIREKVGPETSIILLQNGIGIEEPVQTAFPGNEIISGLAFIFVSRSEMGKINHDDFGRIVIGTYPSGHSEKVDLLNKLFIKAGVPCIITDDIIPARWKKLLWNAPLNPISVLGGGASTVEMMESELVVNLTIKVMEEVMMLAKMSGNTLPEDLIRLTIEETKKMNPYKTSMLHDYETGRPMEVEAILGNTLRIAGIHAVAVPYIESLYALLSLMNRGR